MSKGTFHFESLSLSLASRKSMCGTVARPEGFTNAQHSALYFFLDAKSKAISK